MCVGNVCFCNDLVLVFSNVCITLTEVFPCVFLSCKANARVKLLKDGARPAVITIAINISYHMKYLIRTSLCITYPLKRAGWASSSGYQPAAILKNPWRFNGAQTSVLISLCWKNKVLFWFGWMRTELNGSVLYKVVWGHAYNTWQDDSYDTLRDDLYNTLGDDFYGTLCQ
jgi:hypothetical protein